MRTCFVCVQGRRGLSNINTQFSLRLDGFFLHRLLLGSTRQFIIIRILRTGYYSDPFPFTPTPLSSLLPFFRGSASLWYVTTGLRCGCSTTKLPRSPDHHCRRIIRGFGIRINSSRINTPCMAFISSKKMLSSLVT